MRANCSFEEYVAWVASNPESAAFTELALTLEREVSHDVIRRRVAENPADRDEQWAGALVLLEEQEVGRSNGYLSLDDR